MEEINRHMGSVNLSPTDIPENTFEIEDNVQFDSSKLDYECPEKEKITQAVVKMLKKIIDISNSNLIKNTDGLLSTRSVDEEVEWVGKDKKGLPDNIRYPVDSFSYKKWKIYHLKSGLLSYLIYHRMTLLKPVLPANCFLTSLGKILSLKKNYYIQDCYLTTLVPFLIATRMHVYRFMVSFVSLLESMLSVKIIL